MRGGRPHLRGNFRDRHWISDSCFIEEVARSTGPCRLHVITARLHETHTLKWISCRAGSTRLARASASRQKCRDEMAPRRLTKEMREHLPKRWPIGEPDAH
jgi:hypothetical protein